METLETSNCKKRKTQFFLTKNSSLNKLILKKFSLSGKIIYFFNLLVKFNLIYNCRNELFLKFN